MTDNLIIEEILRYLSDESYHYAVLIDGEWGCGKTYFVQHVLREQIESIEKESGNPRKFKYISLYGCNSVQDIQENIVWGFSNEVKNYVAASSDEKKAIVNNILLTSKKIGSAALKKFGPSEINAYGLVSDWLTMKSYIFVFDDVERCDCPLNEVFGFINGLVEHEGTKVILVANERQISMCESTIQKELQYSVVLSDKIIWPLKEKKNLNSYSGQGDRVDFETLEERRKALFPDEEYDEIYRIIREKLIGVTLRFQPDTKKITKEMVENSNMEDKLKEVLLLHMDEFYFVMEQYGHYNLRTFQFFLSKICYLYSKFNDVLIETDYNEKAISFLIQDCFICAVYYKGNISIPTDQWEWAQYEARRKSLAVKLYVETGEFDSNKFKHDIEKYVEDELKNKLSMDDPFNLLYQEYYFHKQSWCEEKLEEVKQRLEDNKYPLYVYAKLIVLLLRLIQLGFSEVYLQDIKGIIFKNISNMKDPVKLDNDDLFFIEDKEIKQNAEDIFAEINLAIVAQDKQMKKRTMKEILSDEKWVEKLIDYTECNKGTMDISIFAKAESCQWIRAIMSASIGNINRFRQWFDSYYLKRTLRKGTKIDLPVLKEIMEGIHPEEESDLIKRANLSWLRTQIEEVLE